MPLDLSSSMTVSLSDNTQNSYSVSSSGNRDVTRTFTVVSFCIALMRSDLSSSMTVSMSDYMQNSYSVSSSGNRDVTRTFTVVSLIFNQFV